MGGIAKSYELLHVKDSLAVIFNYSEIKEICIFYRWNWRHPRCPDEGDVARFGRDFVVIAGSGYERYSFKKYPIKVYNWDKYSQSWKERILSTGSVKGPLLAASNRMFLLHNDDLLSMWYRDHGNKWQVKVIIALLIIVETNEEKRSRQPVEKM